MAFLIRISRSWRVGCGALNMMLVASAVATTTFLAPFREGALRTIDDEILLLVTIVLNALSVVGIKPTTQHHSTSRSFHRNVTLSTVLSLLCIHAIMLDMAAPGSVADFGMHLLLLVPWVVYHGACWKTLQLRERYLVGHYGPYMKHLHTIANEANAAAGQPTGNCKRSIMQTQAQDTSHARPTQANSASTW